MQEALQARADELGHVMLHTRMRTICWWGAPLRLFLRKGIDNLWATSFTGPKLDRRASIRFKMPTRRTPGQPPVPDGAVENPFSSVKKPRGSGIYVRLAAGRCPPCVLVCGSPWILPGRRCGAWRNTRTGIREREREFMKNSLQH